MGIFSCFAIIFSKGKNFHDFLFAPLSKVPLPHWGLFSKERICSKRSKFFPLRIIPCRNGRQNNKELLKACLYSLDKSCFFYRKKKVKITRDEELFVLPVSTFSQNRAQKTRAPHTGAKARLQLLLKILCRKRGITMSKKLEGYLPYWYGFPF